MDDQNTDPLPVITEEDYIPDQELDEAHLIKERPALPLEASPSASMAPSGVVPPVAATSNSSDMTAGTVSTTEMVEQVPSGEESYIPAQSMQQTTAQMVLQGQLAVESQRQRQNMDARQQRYFLSGRNILLAFIVISVASIVVFTLWRSYTESWTTASEYYKLLLDKLLTILGVVIGFYFASNQERK